MAEKINIKNLLTPSNLHTVKGLELLAKTTVQTFLPGLNTSSKVGIGQEFSQYRSYQPGDDLRLLDWKKLARSDRLYIRESEAETNVTIKFVLDASASMLHEEKEIHKLDFARYLVATLAWMAEKQGDKIGLYALNNQQFWQFPPKVGQTWFRQLLYQLLKIDGVGVYPSQNQVTTIANPRQKEIIFFLTDMYESEKELMQTLVNLKTAKNEVVLFHLLSEKELTLDYKGVVTFEDLETRQQIQMNIKADKQQYLQKLTDWQNQLKKELLNQQIDYQLVNVSESVGAVLKNYLKMRTKF